VRGPRVTDSICCQVIRRIVLVDQQPTFSVRRGTNISHWLSQSKARGAERKAFFTQADVQRIADWGFDHLRLPIDEEQMWDEQGDRHAEAFELMGAALDWCAAAGLKVIVDLHILRSHYFDTNAKPLFTNPAEAERFAGLWRDLSACLNRRPIDQVAYELMNEPVADNDEDWNRVYPHAFSAIRQLEPDRTIVVGSNRWSQVITFPNLKVINDRRQILTFHYYNPMLLTHYRAPWTNVHVYTGPVHYPGLQAEEAHIATLSEENQAIIRQSNKHYDRVQIARDIETALAVARRENLPLYCGEFGVYKVAPAEPRMRWYRDIISVFDEFGISWANWDYKGGFGLVDGEGRSTGLAELLLEKA
jgi:endoglucanase